MANTENTPENERDGSFSGGGGWWWLSGRGHTPENEHDGSFLGVVDGGGCQGEVNLPKTSVTARFRGLWVVVG